MIAHVLRRLGALVSGPPRADFSGIPPNLLRDVGLDGSHIRMIAVSPREQDTAPSKRPFSFRTHPASELVELRDRSAVASVSDFRHNIAGSLAA